MCCSRPDCTLLLCLIALLCARQGGGAFVASSIHQAPEAATLSSTPASQSAHLFSWSHNTMSLQPLSSQLFSRSLPTALRCLYHPFLYGLATGKMPRSTFQNYVGQDYFFLHSFSDAYLKAGAILKAKGDAEGAETFSTLAAGVADELNLHKSYAAKWEVDLTKVQAQDATQKYVDFLQSTATEQSKVSVICSAMAPCMRLYAFLGSSLKRSLPSKSTSSSPGDEDENPYAEWIDTYAAEDFEGLAETLEKLLDKYAVQEGASIEELSAPFDRAMELEYNFFDKQPGGWDYSTPSVGPEVFAVDFDQTLTEKDTSAVISGLSMSALPTKEAKAEWQAAWDNVASSFYAAYEARVSSLLPSECHGSFNPEGLAEFCKGMSAFEKESLVPVEEGKFLAGITKEALKEAGLAVSLQKSALATLQAGNTKGASLHVVSVNWSQDFIRGALQQVEPFTISSPNLEFPEGGGASTGRLAAGSISGAIDKEKIMGELASARNGQSVYVGDSVTDVLALLRADVGIVVGKSRTLRKVLDAYGVQLVPLVGAVLPGSARGPKGGVLYEAISWDDISLALFGESL